MAKVATTMTNETPMANVATTFTNETSVAKVATNETPPMAKVALPPLTRDAPGS